MMTEHVDYVCPGDHERRCMFCDGGLWACSVCDSFEGATTTECPGERMSPETATDVYNGRLDYIDGEWKPQASKYCPLGRRVEADR